MKFLIERFGEPVIIVCEQDGDTYSVVNAYNAIDKYGECTYNPDADDLFSDEPFVWLEGEGVVVSEDIADHYGIEEKDRTCDAFKFN